MRARALAQPPKPESTRSGFLEVLSFRIGDGRYALETRYVTAVLRDADVTPLPGSDGAVVGVTNLRGEILAVVSLSQIFNATSTSACPEKECWIVVVGIDHAVFGIMVTEVSEVLLLPLDKLHGPVKASRVMDCGLVQTVAEDATILIDGAVLLEDRRFILDEK